MLDSPTPNIHECIRKTARELHFHLLAWSEIRLGSGARYLVKNLLPIIGLIVVYGPPKCGKTFWLFDLVMHVALGWWYRGRRTLQGIVVYCLFEGQAGFAARAEAFRQTLLAEHAEDVPFHLMPVKLQLVRDHGGLIAAIRQQTESDPAVVVLDTLNRSFTGSESNDSDMTDYVRACDAIRQAFQCAVIVVHHSGLEGGRARGHTALLGAADAQIGVVRDAASNIVATVEYMKDGADGDEIVSQLRVVEVGIDDDGEPITSCIVEPADTAPQTRRREPTGQPGIALRALKMAISEHGEIHTNSARIPSTSRFVRMDLWQTYTDKLGLTEKGASADSRARAFRRVRLHLQSVGLIDVWGDCAWLTD